MLEKLRQTQTQDHQISKPAFNLLDPVVQIIISLTSLLRGQLVKSFMTSLPNTLKFFVKKNEISFCTAKLLIFFQQNY